MKVYVLFFVHKHGEDISVWETEEKARAVATQLILDRAAGSWNMEDHKRINAMTEFDDRLAYFEAVEQNISYGERIEILERPVQ